MSLTLQKKGYCICTWKVSLLTCQFIHFFIVCVVFEHSYNKVSGQRKLSAHLKLALSILHKTFAACILKAKSAHIVPQTPSIRISTRPSSSLLPPTNRIGLSLTSSVLYTYNTYHSSWIRIFGETCMYIHVYYCENTPTKWPHCNSVKPLSCCCLVRDSLLLTLCSYTRIMCTWSERFVCYNYVQTILRLHQRCSI